MQSHDPSRDPGQNIVVTDGESPPARAPTPASHGDTNVQSAPGTGKRITISVAIFAAILLISFVVVRHVRARHEDELAAQNKQAADTPLAVDVVRAMDASATQSLTLPAETSAWYHSPINAQVTGYVASWSVDIGDHVRKGQVLAQIETPEVDAQLLAAQAKLAAAQAQVNVAQANADLANSTNARWSESPKGVVSDQERQEKRAEYEGSRARLEAARAQVAVDRAEVSRLTTLTDFKNVTAPYDGVITSRKIDIGDLVSGSAQNTTPLFEMTQFDRIRLFAGVPQSAGMHLRVGMVAHIIVSEFPSRVFTGTITRTSSAIDPAAKTLQVEVDLPNPDLALLPGMYVQVSFDVPHPGLVQVPASAMLFRTDGIVQVAVVDSENHLHFRDVTIGVDQGNAVDLSEGIQPGERVALNISNQMTDGQTVQAEETASDETPANAPPATRRTRAASAGSRTLAAVPNAPVAPAQP